MTRARAPVKAPSNGHTHRFVPESPTSFQWTEKGVRRIARCEVGGCPVRGPYLDPEGRKGT